MSDAVNHPDYYTYGGVETLDYIMAKDLDFARGSVIKYVSRAGLKDPEKELEDLEKARFFLDVVIEKIEKKADPGTGSTEEIMLLKKGDTNA